MQEQIITIYCLCADFLIAYGHKDDIQAQMTTAEVMTTALVAAQFFHGNQELACLFLKEHGYMPKMLSKSRFNRRLHAIGEATWQALFSLLGEIAKQLNPDDTFIIDSMPVPVCDNIRICRCRLYPEERYRGYIASKRRHFYGLRVHLLVTESGYPVEVTFTPGSVSDLVGFKQLPLDLPEKATIYADKGYNDYVCEDTLQEIGAAELIAQRKKNSKRVHPGWIIYLCQVIRKRVETTFSQIAEHFAKSIHAVTPRGFELKVFLTILAYAITA
jgi:DDE family transposase